MRIGELARRAATTTRALRYYESRGLLSAQRDDAGYRVYGEHDLHVLRQIRTLQDIGFDLEEIRPFVECLREGNPTGDSCPASSEVYRNKLAEIEECIAQLEGVRNWIRDQLTRNDSDATDRGEPPSCEWEPPGIHAARSALFTRRAVL
ncbi:MerR family transcriptional regulator [Nocardia sp. NPDC057668]|uniref:MerR family transcriptional regulator n=1 Tax=Nocardia sp. NPDC057668 TaxID=3346202 RepID=UPI00366FD5CF